MIYIVNDLHRCAFFLCHGATLKQIIYDPKTYRGQFYLELPPGMVPEIMLHNYMEPFEKNVNLKTYLNFLFELKGALEGAKHS